MAELPARRRTSLDVTDDKLTSQYMMTYPEEVSKIAKVGRKPSVAIEVAGERDGTCENMKGITRITFTLQVVQLYHFLPNM